MIGFIGGTGPEGMGLAIRFLAAGEEVIIGSRDKSRAQESASILASMSSIQNVSSGRNIEVAEKSDVVFIAVPYSALKGTLEEIKVALTGKIVVEVVAPLEFIGKRARAISVAGGSVAEEAQNLVPNSAIVAAFQTISAHDLLDLNMVVDSDVVVCSDDDKAKVKVMALAEKIHGVRAINGGELSNARYVEGMTALLLNINKLYKARSAIKIRGI